MYSVVLMMAMTGSGDAVAHCGKACACSTTVVVSCGAKHSHGKLFGGCSCGFGHSLFGGHHSCNSNVCSTPVTTCSTSCGHSHSFFRGHSCNSSCGGHGFGGLFRRHHNSCSAPVVVVCSGS